MLCSCGYFLHHPSTTLLSLFSNRKCHKEVCTSLYAGICPCITFARPIWAAGLNIFLFFWTLLHSSSHSSGVIPRVFMRYSFISVACSAISSNNLPIVSRWWHVIRSILRIPFFSTKCLQILIISLSDSCFRYNGVPFVSMK